jgi:drug/metabolite transporter (DMT)-like permease
MGIEVSLIFAFAAMLCWGIGDFLIQKSTRKVGDLEALAFIGIIGTLMLLPFVLKDIHSLLSLPNLLLLCFLGIITFVAAMFDFEALKKGKLSVIEVIIELELPITIALGFIFFKERLSLLQFVVISFIFVGIILIATKSFKHLRLKLEKGVLIALIAAIGMGLINFLTAASSKQISPLMAVWFPWVVFSVICMFVLIKEKGLVKTMKNARKFKWLILAMGIFDTFAWVFYAHAVLQEEISIITAITESYPAVAMVLGVWINREKIRWHQWTGAAIALLCSFMLAFVV